MEIAKFNPAKEEIQAAVMEVEGLTIAGVDDVAGYEAVKAGKKKLAEYRIKITKFGKEQRDEAIKYQKGVIAAERELLEMITPTEDELKAKIEAVDAEKARTERMILLPSRKLMLYEIGTVLTDEEILNFDEKEFSEMYTEKKMAYLEEQDRKRKDEERQKQHEEDIKRASEEATKRATEEAERKAKAELERVEKEKQEAIASAEREKQEAIDKIKQEQEEAKKKRIEEEERKIAEAERIERERAETQDKAEKNKKYQDWITGLEINLAIGDKIERVGEIFIAYKKVGEITIK